MHKLLAFTDIHILEPGEEIIGLNPSERFAQGLAHALAHHSDAEAIVLMGDLTHHGRPAQYAELARLLADVPLPVIPLVGNHDLRAPFFAQFPDAPRDAAGFVQTAFDLGQVRAICLDTTAPEIEPYHAGHLCDARLGWLKAELEAAENRPALVIQHHPPMPLGFDGMDAIALDNGTEELALLDAHGGVHMLLGHVHRTISGRVGQTSYSVFKSTCHQMPMILGQGSSGLSVDEPGAYGIILARGDDIIVHSEDYALAALNPADDPTSKG